MKHIINGLLSFNEYRIQNTGFRILFKIFLIIAFIINQSIIFCQEGGTQSVGNISSREMEFFKKRLNTKSNSAGNNYDVKYHRVHWFIDPDTMYIKGNVFSLFRINKDSTGEVIFNLSSFLHVDSVVSFHTHLLFTHSENLLYIQLPEKFNSGSYDSMCIYYQGIPGSSSGFGSFQKGYHGGTPIISTLSEPYGSSDWWPCHNVLNDKIDSMDIYITTPAGFSAASNGILASTYNSGASTTFYWKHRYPISTYLVALAVTNYYEFTDYAHFGNDSMEIRNYCYPEDTAAAFENAYYTAGMMSYFGTFFGDYPFKKEKYGHAQFEWGGGMEHQTITFLGGFNYGLMVHELAHSWFGDMVTCGSWQDLWLNEGFATYLSGFLYDWDPPVFRDWKKHQIEDITRQPGGSVFVKDTANIDRLFDGRLTYNKGSMLVHMLRYVMGDENFFKAIKNYLNDPKLAYGYARTADLKQHLEAVGKEDLTYFFNEWLYGEGYPLYLIRCTRYPGNELRILVNQSTRPVASPFFRMKIPVRFYGEGKDTTMYFQNTFNGQVFWVTPGFKTDSVVFNPEYDIITKDSRVFLDSASEYPQDVLISPNPFIDSVTLTQNNADILHIEIYDYSGKSVYKSEKKKVAGEVNTINLSNLRKGTYIIRIKTNKGTQNSKIIKL